MRQILNSRSLFRWQFALAWRSLGSLEATNGPVMFGVSAAMVFAGVQPLVLASVGISEGER